MNPFDLITKPIGCLFSLVASLLTFAILLLLFCWFGIGILLAPVVKNVVSQKTTYKTQVDGVMINPFYCTVEVKDISFANPEGYVTDSALDVARLEFQSNYNDLFSGGVIPIDTVTIEIPRVSLIENADGNNLRMLLASVDATLKAAQRDATTYEFYGRRFSFKNIRMKIDLVEEGKSAMDGVTTRKVTVSYERTFSGFASLSDVFGALAADMQSRGLYALSGTLRSILPPAPGSAEDIWNKTKKAIGL